MISDSILESDEGETEEENENKRGKPLATLCVLKNDHIPESGNFFLVFFSPQCKLCKVTARSVFFNGPPCVCYHRNAPLFGRKRVGS